MPLATAIATCAALAAVTLGTYSISAVAPAPDGPSTVAAPTAACTFTACHVPDHGGDGEHSAARSSHLVLQP